MKGDAAFILRNGQKRQFPSVLFVVCAQLPRACQDLAYFHLQSDPNKLIATYTGVGNSDLNITFTDADLVTAQMLDRRIPFRTTPSAAPGERWITITLNDGGSLSQVTNMIKVSA